MDHLPHRKRFLKDNPQTDPPKLFESFPSHSSDQDTQNKLTEVVNNNNNNNNNSITSETIQDSKEFPHLKKIKTEQVDSEAPPVRAHTDHGLKRLLNNNNNQATDPQTTFTSSQHSSIKELLNHNPRPSLLNKGLAHQNTPSLLNKGLPHQNTPSLKEEKQKEEIYCICRRPDDPQKYGFMIGCDSCDQWFHGRCVNVTQLQADKCSQWVCPRCDPDAFSNTKCRMCSAFAKLASKYCSDKCGKQYAREIYHAKQQEKKEKEAELQSELMHNTATLSLEELKTRATPEDLIQIEQIQKQLQDISRRAYDLAEQERHFNRFVDTVDSLLFSAEQERVKKEEELRQKEEVQSKRQNNLIPCPYLCDELVLIEELNYHKEECFFGKKSWRKALSGVPENQICGFPLAPVNNFDLQKLKSCLSQKADPIEEASPSICKNRRISCLHHPNWQYYQLTEIRIQQEQLALKAAQLLHNKLTLEKKIRLYPKREE